MNYFILTAGTIVLILFSWFLSVKHKRYHGIPRFFVFESVLILLLLNGRYWFTEPFTGLHLLSWLLLIFSLYPVISGYLLLKSKGSPDSNFENTSILVSSGIYKHIRHPLYLSIFLFGMGVMLKKPGNLQLVLGFLVAVSVYITAKTEEGEMIEKFGDEYRDYMKHTKMFIPGII